MDPQAPIIQDPVVPPAPKQSSNSSNVTIFSMALFILLSLGAVAFLYYQNQQLKSMLASYQTPIASPTPTTSASPTIASYSSNQFSFSLPQGWTTTNPNPSNSTFDSNGKNLSDTLRLTVVDTSQPYNGLECNDLTKKVTKKVGNQSITINYYSGIDGGMCNNPEARFITFVVAKDFLVSYIYQQTNAKNAEMVFDQILSTFKFTDQSLTDPVVTSPVAKSKVVSPLKITGTVPTGWMFEGTFPVQLVDSNRNLIAQGSAKEVTPGSWQSGKPVSFSVSLPFSTTDSSGTLILSNDNPSGDPSKAKFFEVPVNF